MLNNVLFSNNIRLNIDKIPYRNHLIIKKFDVAKFNFKQKPKLSNNFSANYTDSEIDNIKTEENLVLAKALFKESNKLAGIYWTPPNIKIISNFFFSPLTGFLFKKTILLIFNFLIFKSACSISFVLLSIAKTFLESFDKIAEEYPVEHARSITV